MPLAERKSVVHFFISDSALIFLPLVRYLFNLIESRFEIKFIQSTHEQHTISFSGERDNYTYFLNPDIYQSFLINSVVSDSFVEDYHVFIHHEKYTIDPLASIFYILHCFQEKNQINQNTQNHERPFYNNSYQFKNDIHNVDLITPLIAFFLEKYVKKPIKQKELKKQIVLTHDIDMVYGGFKQEVSYFFERPTFALFKALIAHFFGKKYLWDNLDEISDIEIKYGYKSIFFFLTEMGYENGIKQSDYSISKLQHLANRVLKCGHEIGLHKSTKAKSYSHELEKLEPFQIISNRNHYFKYNSPSQWFEMSKCGILVDYGMGWTDYFGLRNSYPMPFMPFYSDSEYPLLIVPTILMDTSIKNHFPNSIANISHIFEKMTTSWQNGFCVSILFHNNFLSPWSNKEFLLQYEKILKWIQKNDIEVVTSANIIQSYQLNSQN